MTHTHIPAVPRLCVTEGSIHTPRRPAYNSSMKFREHSEDEARCCFCRKSYRTCGPLIEGAPKLYICRECVDLCQQIFEMEAIRRGVGAHGESASLSSATKSHPDVRYRVVGTRADGDSVVVDELPMERALDMQFRLMMAKVLHNVTIEPIEPQTT